MTNTEQKIIDLLEQMVQILQLSINKQHDNTMKTIDVLERFDKRLHRIEQNTDIVPSDRFDKDKLEVLAGRDLDTGLPVVKVMYDNQLVETKLFGNDIFTT